MGYLLRRMIRDGAPDAWSPLMRLVAMEIADDARDPGDPPPDAVKYGPAYMELYAKVTFAEWPSSWIPVEGRFDRRGKWRPGLTERCGVSARRISAALSELAAAGYEMRRQILDRVTLEFVTDRRGRPVFAYRGRSMTFQVPPLLPRPTPESTSELTTIEPERSSVPVLKVVRSDDPSLIDLPVQPTPQSGVPQSHLQVEGSGNGEIKTFDFHSRGGTHEAYLASADALTEWTLQNPEVTP